MRSWERSIAEESASVRLRSQNSSLASKPVRWVRVWAGWVLLGTCELEVQNVQDTPSTEVSACEFRNSYCRYLFRAGMEDGLSFSASAVLCCLRLSISEAHCNWLSCIVRSFLHLISSFPFQGRIWLLFGASCMIGLISTKHAWLPVIWLVLQNHRIAHNWSQCWSFLHLDLAKSFNIFARPFRSFLGLIGEHLYCS